MKAAVVNVKGEMPQYQHFSEPVAGDGEAIVQMQAAGLHPIVKGLASGQHYASGGALPAVVGIDGVGMLDGKLVYCFSARNPYGTMAERTVVKRAACIPIPDGIEATHAAAIVNPGMSAWLSLKLRAELIPGETVLILGATGVAGQLAIQAARYLGAKKIIAVGRNSEVLATLGADAIITLTESEEAVQEAFTAQLQDGGIDVVINYLWGQPTELFLSALAKCFRPDSTRRIRMVEVGAMAGNTITLPASILRSVDLHLSGSGFGSVPIEQIMASIPTFFDLAAEGHLRVAVQPVPLAEVTAAWSAVEKGKRIVFTV